MTKANVVSVKAAGAMLAKLYIERLSYHQGPLGILSGRLLVVSDSAPDTYETLRDEFYKNNTLCVSSAHSETSIYPDVRHNVLFRFHHDLMHMKYKRTFSFADEVQAAHDGFSDICAAMKDIRPEDRAFLRDVYFADTIGQATYYQKWGEHVQDQQAFVLKYLQTGNLPKDRV